MITEKEILSTDFKKAKKRVYIWADDYYLKYINPEYGYFLYATLHVPTKVWRESKLAQIEDQMCNILLHRSYNVEDPTKNWDGNVDNRDSIIVYKGYINNKKHLKKLIKDTGIR